VRSLFSVPDSIQADLDSFEQKIMANPNLPKLATSTVGLRNLQGELTSTLETSCDSYKLNIPKNVIDVGLEGVIISTHAASYKLSSGLSDLVPVCEVIDVSISTIINKPAGIIDVSVNSIVDSSAEI
jgi:hypothetical protein